MAISIRGVDALQNKLEEARESLKGVDENIKKLTGRDPSENRIGMKNPQNDIRGGRSLFNEARRGLIGNTGRVVIQRRPLGNAFSRLGPRPRGRSPRRDSGDEEELPNKPAVQSSIVATAVENKSRTDNINKLNKDEKGRQRNRRMLGNLLVGTLLKFQDEAKSTQTVVEKRKEVEQKLERKAREERNEVRKERQQLFNNRRQQQAKMKRLEHKLELVELHTHWEEETRKLGLFARTDVKPHIYFKPKRMTEEVQKKIVKSAEAVEVLITERKKKLEEDIEELMKQDEEGEHEDHSHDEDETQQPQEEKQEVQSPTEKRKRSEEPARRAQDEVKNERRGSLEKRKRSEEPTTRRKRSEELEKRRRSEDGEQRKRSEERENRNRKRSEDREKRRRSEEHGKRKKSEERENRKRSEERGKRKRSQEREKSKRSEEREKRKRSEEREKRKRSEERGKRNRSEEREKRNRSEEREKRKKSEEHGKRNRSGDREKRNRSEEREKRNRSEEREQSKSRKARRASNDGEPDSEGEQQSSVDKRTGDGVDQSADSNGLSSDLKHDEKMETEDSETVNAGNDDNKAGSEEEEV